jgi:hypothetical protein
MTEAYTVIMTHWPGNAGACVIEWHTKTHWPGNAGACATGKTP